MRNRMHRSYLCLVLFMFFFSVFIAWCVPYTADDWNWGREIGITNWLTGIYNNRYVGSFFVIIMTRSQLLKTLIMAVTMTCLPLLCTYLSVSTNAPPPPNRIPLCVLTYFVAFSMPVFTWRQTYGWVAGFSNFTMGAFFLMLLLALLKNALSAPPRHPRALRVGCFLLGFAAQLCSENISLFFPFFLFGAFLLLRLWKRQELRSIFVWTLLGTVLGTILMFFNPLYINLATTGVSREQFRSLTFSPDDPIPTILQTLLTLFFGEILPSLYESHPVLVLFLAVGAWIDLFPKRKTASFLLCLPMLVYGIGCCYCAANMSRTFGWLPASAHLRAIGAIVFTALWLLCVLLSPHRSKWHILAFSLFALAIITPFAAINYVGTRCYHISHFCLLVAGATHYTRIRFPNPAKLLLAAALALSLCRLSQAYAAIGTCSALRQELTEYALETQSDTLVLPSMDSRYTYSWGYNPQSEVRAEHYREFYGLPADLDLVFLPYGTVELWPDIPEQMYGDAMVYPGQ